MDDCVDPRAYREGLVADAIQFLDDNPGFPVTRLARDFGLTRGMLRHRIEQRDEQRQRRLSKAAVRRGEHLYQATSDHVEEVSVSPQYHVEALPQAPIHTAYHAPVQSGARLYSQPRLQSPTQAPQHLQSQASCQQPPVPRGGLSLIGGKGPDGQPNTILSSEEEAEIFKYVRQLDPMRRGVQYQFLTDAANAILQGRLGDSTARVGNTWSHRLLARQQYPLRRKNPKMSEKETLEAQVYIRIMAHSAREKAAEMAARTQQGERERQRQDRIEDHSRSQSSSRSPSELSGTDEPRLMPTFEPID